MHPVWKYITYISPSLQWNQWFYFSGTASADVFLIQDGPESWRRKISGGTLEAEGGIAVLLVQRWRCLKDLHSIFEADSR